MSAIHGLTMPKWGLSMTEGKIVAWLVGEGAEVISGVELVEIETEKILGSLEAPVSGQLVEDILKYKRLDGVETALRTIAGQFCPGGQQAVVLRDRLTRLSMPIMVTWRTPGNN